MAEAQTISVAEIARIVGRTTTTVYSAARKGDIPARRFAGGWIFPRAQFFEWLNQTQKYEQPDPIVLKCSECKSAFEVYDGRQMRRLYCSARCKQLAYRKRSAVSATDAP